MKIKPRKNRPKKKKFSFSVKKKKKKKVKNKGRCFSCHWFYNAPPLIRKAIVYKHCLIADKKVRENYQLNCKYYDDMWFVLPSLPHDLKKKYYELFEKYSGEKRETTIVAEESEDNTCRIRPRRKRRKKKRQ